MRWSVVAAIAGIAAVVMTIWYGERQLRLARRQLELAEEQVKQRPSLEVTLPVRQLRHLPPEATAKGYVHDAYLNFEITNVSGTAAHNVDCRFEFDTEHLEPLGTGNFGFPMLPPSSPHNMQVNVRIHTREPSWVRYCCTYDEGEPITGVIEFEIPKLERGD
jgi:hypothetical protein